MVNHMPTDTGPAVGMSDVGIAIYDEVPFKDPAVASLNLPACRVTVLYAAVPPRTWLRGVTPEESAKRQ